MESGLVLMYESMSYTQRPLEAMNTYLVHNIYPLPNVLYLSLCKCVLIVDFILLSIWGHIVEVYV